LGRARLTGGAHPKAAAAFQAGERASRLGRLGRHGPKARGGGQLGHGEAGPRRGEEKKGGGRPAGPDWPAGLGAREGGLRAWLGRASWAAQAGRAERGRGGKGEKERFFPFFNPFSKSMFSQIQSTTKRYAGTGMVQQLNKIFLGFIIIICLGVLKVGRVLAKRNGKEVMPEFSERYKGRKKLNSKFGALQTYPP
jgi:hypothetical protein